MNIDDIAEVIADAIKDATAPLLAEIEVLKARVAEKGEPGERGEKGDVGPVGKEGPQGRDGRDGQPGRDGEDGRDGKDGKTFTLDDFDINQVDDRTIELAFTNGTEKHSFELKFAVPLYRGVYREDATYSAGDMLSWAGALWHCDKDANAERPGGDGWTLAVKKGRDGKDAR